MPSIWFFKGRVLLLITLYYIYTLPCLQLNLSLSLIHQSDARAGGWYNKL